MKRAEQRRGNEEEEEGGVSDRAAPAVEWLLSAKLQYGLPANFWPALLKKLRE